MKLLKASGWSVSHAARLDVSTVGSGNEKIYCVYDYVCVCDPNRIRKDLC